MKEGLGAAGKLGISKYEPLAFKDAKDFKGKAIISRWEE
jgi:hypothetical protein